MKSFWAFAARHWAPAFPSWELEAALGRDAVERLLAAGILRREAIRPWERVVCPECRMNARVLWERGEAVVACEADTECPFAGVGAAPHRLVVDAGDFARLVAEAFELRGSVGEGPVIPLGRRCFGDEEVAVDLCPNPRAFGVGDALHRLARGGPRVRVVLAVDSGTIPASPPVDVAGAELVWAGLDEVLLVEERLRVDYRPIARRRAFAGFQVQKRGLVVGERAATWRGVVVETTPRALKLLRGLSRNPGGAPRALLWRELWPDDHTRTGQLARGMSPLTMDGRLRKCVLELRAALGEEAVVTLPGSDDLGGYRLAVAVEREAAA